MKNAIGLLFLLIISNNLQGQLTISEILYNQPLWDNDLQYIELLNFSDETIDLSQWSISCDISLPSLPDIKLEPNERYLISSDFNAMISLGVVTDMGEWAPNDQIIGDPFFLISDSSGETVVRIDYDEDLNWPVAPRGVAIELCDPSLDINNGMNWALAENSLFSGGNELLGTPGVVNSCFETSTSTSNTIAADQIKIYPNPCYTILNIESDTNFDSLRILDMNGVQIFEASNSQVIDVSSLQPGFYILSLISGQTTINRHLVKS